MTRRRSVTVGHWTRGSRERAEYGEAEHAAIHAAIEILRETGGALPPRRPRPTTAAARRDWGTSTSGQTLGDFPAAAAQQQQQHQNHPTGAAQELTEEIRPLELAGGARSAGRTPTRRTSPASRRCTTKIKRSGQSRRGTLAR